MHLGLGMPKEAETGDLFEADGVTPKVEKPVITEAELKATERAARAEGEAAALKAVATAKPVQKQTAEKIQTRQELRAKVNAGEITEDQMDDILERQFEAKLSKKVEETVESRVSNSQTTATIDSQIQAYVGVFPDINKEGSATRAKIQAEFVELVKGGSPESISTELAAIKIVCGQLKTGSRRAAPEPHEEIGGASEGNDRPDTQGWAKGLGPTQKKHYTKMVERGMYKGFTDPKLKAEIALVRRAH